MFLQGLQLLGALWRHFSKNAFQLTQFLQTSQKLLHVVVSVFEQWYSLTTEHLSQLPYPCLTSESVLTAYKHTFVVVFNLRSYFDELSVQNRFTSVQMSVLFAQDSCHLLL